MGGFHLWRLAGCRRQNSPLSQIAFHSTDVWPLQSPLMDQAVGQIIECGCRHGFLVSRPSESSRGKLYTSLSTLLQELRYVLRDARRSQDQSRLSRGVTN